MSDRRGYRDAKRSKIPEEDRGAFVAAAVILGCRNMGQVRGLLRREGFMASRQWITPLLNEILEADDV